MLRIDFSKAELLKSAFSAQAMTFCEPAVKNALVAVMDLLAIETGTRAAREEWQRAQINNLLAHCASRSFFWRRRIGSRNVKSLDLHLLPILTRRDLIAQVASEQSLLRAADRIGVAMHSTSGSSGMPTKFYVSAMNMEYNHIRGMAQYFIEGRDLTKTKTLLQHSPEHFADGFNVERKGSWLYKLDSFFASGGTKHIKYFHPAIKKLATELARDEIGYLIASPRIIEPLLRETEEQLLSNSGLSMWMPIGEGVDASLREKFAQRGVPVRSSYSAEEVGLIASECEFTPGKFHVATSNVVVEIDRSEKIDVNGVELGRVLVTHLHSYATPMIRYDIGDFASLAAVCPCGHDGPTLSNIYGRTKSLLKHADQSITPFYVRNSELLEIVNLREYRIRQTGYTTIKIELCAQDEVTQCQRSRLIELLKRHCTDSFDVEVQVVKEIDWGSDRKRLGYRCDIL